MNNIISIEDLSFKYGEKVIFDRFNLAIKENSFTTLVGLNGSGKTTLVKILVGLVKANGYIKVADNVLMKETKKNVRRDIGVVFENPDNQFVAETVKDDLAFALENLCYSKREIGSKIKEIAKKFKIEHILEKEPHLLSGGEKQIVALASSLITDPKILILDEALTMVDYEIKERIYEIIKEYRKDHNLTVINITHDSEEMLRGDYIAIMSNGKIVVNDLTKTVLKREKLLDNLGIKLPFVVDLSYKLMFYGLIDDIILDEVEMVNTLWK